MTSFAHVQYPHHHPGVDRLERAAKSLKASFAQWQAKRRQAAADRALWQLAQSDSRVMADLICAMGRADVGFKGYFGD
ncbi:MAG TPA: hypothetical protein VKD22_18115 [Ramlibacter sp.]|nr:hypothetical protein [Ramlibacter sp.]